MFVWVDFVAALGPALLMLAALFLTPLFASRTSLLWKWFNALALVALGFSVLALILELLQSTVGTPLPMASFWLLPNVFGTWVSLLVQLLGVAIGFFSSKHLQGELRQPVYVASLAAVLAAVHFLLLANHWVVLIVAWAAIGLAMHQLLCFYPERPFALLAAHKKRIADRAADLMLMTAAALVWWTVGSGNLSRLWAYLDTGQHPFTLQLSALFLVGGVIIRTALLPVHGWIVQVMEAPTPVSALLHAGVVNLGGYVLVFFAPLLNVSPLAHWLLVIFGLSSAILGGVVMLTRVSIKVHLAWSTIGQMGFMLLECGLGLYTLAALHLIGHSLYKAHSFLSASSAVRHARLGMLRQPSQSPGTSLVLAPFVAIGIVLLVQWATQIFAWPWWWTGVLVFAWSPLLWGASVTQPRRFLAAIGMVAGLTLAACLAFYWPTGALETPFNPAGWLVFVGMAAMYVTLAVLQVWPDKLITLRHWVYGGFYLDDFYTRWALAFWPVNWVHSQQDASAPLVISRDE